MVNLRKTRPAARGPGPWVAAALLVLLAAHCPASPQAGLKRVALVLRVSDAIGPATSDYIRRGLSRAQESGAGVLILELDTPGGLDSAMRDIIRGMIASTVPVVVYVSPSGARAASAGTYILYASHVAAMAPATNLGAATPVQIGGMPDLAPSSPGPEPPGHEKEKASGDPGASGADAGKPSTTVDGEGGTMHRKMVNDAVAYIRSLAELRGRNADWAERAVRESASLSAESALKENVIDLMAVDLDDLLHKIDGRVIRMHNGNVTLHTQGLPVSYLEPDWRTRLLAVITNPNMAYVLMLLGVYGLFFELANPGHVVPGVIGAISLVLALYAFQVLPVNYAGLGLIALGIAFMVAELFVSSFGVLGIGGVISFVIGSVFLFDREGGGMAVSMPLIIAVSVLTAAFFLVALRIVVQAHRRRVVSGAEELIGSTGEVLEDFEGKGNIHIHGENWRARSRVALHTGDRVRVISRDGLVLDVEPAAEEKHP